MYKRIYQPDWLFNLKTSALSLLSWSLKAIINFKMLHIQKIWHLFTRSHTERPYVSSKSVKPQKTPMDCAAAVQEASFAVPHLFSERSAATVPESGPDWQAELDVAMLATRPSGTVLNIACLSHLQ